MTRRRLFSRAFGCAVLALTVPDRLWAAQATLGPATLTIAGDVSKSPSLAPADLKTLPRTRVEVEEDGRTLMGARKQ